MNKIKDFWSNLNLLAKTMLVVFALCQVLALVLTATANAQEAPVGGKIGHYETNTGSEDDRLSIYASCIKPDGSQITDLPGFFAKAEDRANHYGFAVIPLEGKSFEVDLAVGTVSNLGVFLKQINLDAAKICQTLK